MIKQRPSRNETRFQWVEGATMPADVRQASEETATLRSTSNPRNLRDVGGKTTSS